MEKYPGYNPYPETLKAIRSKEGEFASLEKRKQAITEIKEALRKQQEGLGLFIKALYDRVHDKKSHPTFNEILDTLEKFSKRYDFNEEQLDQIRSSLKDYWRKHMQVEGERILFENAPEKFFEECFKIEPQDSLSVIYGSMTVTFMLSDVDYEAAYMHNKVLNVEKERERAKDSVGGAFSTVKNDLFSGIINIVRRTQGEGVIRHEEQHQINRLFTPQEDRQELSQSFLEDIIEKEIVKKSRRKKIIFSLAKNFRKHEVDPLARNEILAQLRNKNNTEDIYNTLANNSSYQYFDEKTIERTADEIKGLFNSTKRERGISDYQFRRLRIPELHMDYEALKIPSTNEVTTAVESAYQNYYADIKQALESVQELQESGLANEDIIPLLQVIPLDRWSVFVRRLLNNESASLDDGKVKNWLREIFGYKGIWEKFRNRQ